jgi:NADH dehydrogenase FAD-containing subunit
MKRISSLTCEHEVVLCALLHTCVCLTDFFFILLHIYITQINSKVRYLEAAATEVDPKTNTLSCISIVCEGNSCETEEFEIGYDRLVFSVGAQTTTFGTPGVEEYCNYLKQVGDAQQIKNAIVNCFESAGLPNLTEEEKIKELTFVIIGAGPTGIEFAAELLDFIEENGARFYKDLLPFVRIKIVEAAPSILRPFEDGMKEEAISKLTRTIEIAGVPTLQPLEILTNKLVSEVSGNYVYFKDGEKIPYGMSLWAAGIGQLPITTQLVEMLEETEQKNAQDFARGRLGVDPWLRVIGGDGKIFALGDCSCVSNSPMLPATAQVAAQQGEFLGALLSKEYCFDAMDDKLLPPLPMNPNQSKSLSDQIASFAMGEDEIAAPFQYLDLGILAYTGSGSALAQVQIAPGGGLPGATENWDPVRLQIKGKLGFGLWRSIYLLKMTSPKNAVLVALDWIKVKLFGRDISIL